MCPSASALSGAITIHSGRNLNELSRFELQQLITNLFLALRPDALLLNFHTFHQIKRARPARMSHFALVQREASLANITRLRTPHTWCLLCDELYFGVVLTTRTD
jgi:hypothetical protein